MSSKIFLYVLFTCGKNAENQARLEEEFLSDISLSNCRKIEEENRESVYYKSFAVPSIPKLLQNLAFLTSSIVGRCLWKRQKSQKVLEW